MKKIGILILVVLIIFGTAACGTSIGSKNYTKHTNYNKK